MAKKMNKFNSVLKKVKKTVSLMTLLLVKIAVKLLVVLGVIISLMYFSARAPEIHSFIIRSKVGNKTYRIRGGFNTGGGTGFAVKAKSGTTYIISNAHVCSVSPDGYHVLVSNDEGKHIWRRIIKISDKSDLCLIQGIPGVEGLSLGSKPAIGQIVAAVGHPSLMPITLSRGEIIAPRDVRILKGIIIDPNDPNDQIVSLWIPPIYTISPKECMQPKNEIVKDKMNWFFVVLEVKICLDVTRGAYHTNILIQPGSSGSPVVNFWGNVVGVMFAADRYNWGIAVSHKDLKEFLSHY